MTSFSLIRRILAVVVLMCVASYGAMAQTTDSLRRHVIIAFDSALQPVNSQALANQNATIANIKKLLDAEFSADPLRETDIVSVVQFGIGANASSLRQMIQPVTGTNGKPMVRIPFRQLDKLLGFHDWFEKVYKTRNSKFDGEPYSILSGSKPYTLLALRSENPKEAANKVYLVMVTDERYNNQDDFRKEFEGFIVNTGNKKLSKKEFDKTCANVNGLYSFNFVNESPVWGDGILKALLFEVAPSAMPSLSSLDFPATLGLNRCHGGYELDFDVKSVDNLVSLERFDVEVAKKDGTFQRATADKNGHIHLKVSSSDVNPDSIHVRLLAWARQTGGVFDALTVSPLDYTENSKGVRLRSDRTLTYKEDAHIFGIRMPDWMWFLPVEARTMATIWMVLIVFIIIALVTKWIMRYYKRNSVYRPENKEIHLSFANSRKSLDKE